MSGAIETIHTTLLGSDTPLPKKPALKKVLPRPEPVFVPPKNPLVFTPTNHKITIEGNKEWSLEVSGFHDKASYLSHTIHTDAFRGDYSSIDEVAKKLLEDRSSQKNLEKQKHFIAQSAVDQYDVVARPKFSDDLARRLGYRAGFSDFATQHIVLKNGLNGVSYTAEDGTIIHPKYAAAGKEDFENTHLQMARRIAPLQDNEASPKAPSYCYTGRPDTLDRALEQGTMIFFGEADSNRPKGISSSTNESGEIIYTLTYIVNSLQSSSPFNRDEQASFQKERAALKELQNSGVREITQPQTGKTYKVRFNPVFFSRQVDHYAHMEKGLNSWLAGSKQALEASRGGWNKLRSFASKYIPEKLNLEEQRVAHKLINKIEASINGRHFGSSQMEAAEELLCRSMLSLLLDLPIVYHAKNSSSHTDAGVALHITLSQWVEKGLGLPDNAQMEKLLDNDSFKELFAMNWLASQKAEPSEGTAENIEQSSLLVRLLPRRYIKKESWRVKSLWNASCKRFGKKTTIALTLVSPILFPLLGLAIGVTNAVTTLFTPNNTLSQPKDSGIQRWLIRPVRFVARNLYMVPYHFFTGFFTPFLAAPKKTIHTTRLAKTLGRTSYSFSAPIPAHAGEETPAKLAARMRQIDPSWNSYELGKKSSEEIYDLFFEEHFDHDSRFAPHILKGNVIKQAIIPFQSLISEYLDLIEIRNKKWRINGYEFHNLKSMYQHLLWNYNLDEEAALTIMMNQVPDLGIHFNEQIKLNIELHMPGKKWGSMEQLYSDLTRKNRLFQHLKETKQSLLIDGHSFEQPGHAYTYLVKKGLKKEEALDILSYMQIDTPQYAQNYLKATLASDDLGVDVDLSEASKPHFHLDTGLWTLTIQNEHEVYRENETEKEIHATIRATTVLNCNPKSDEYGQGSIQCELAGDYIPLSKKT